MLIRDAFPNDEPSWRRLWAGYLAFYERELPEEVTAKTWERLIRRSDGLHGRMAETSSGEVCGFALCVVHAGSWSIDPVCYLEDLFVDPAHRGRGIGEALIRDLTIQAKANKWSGLYWHTRSSNATARSVYDRFTMADDFVRYRLSF